ncbi:N-acetylglucosamine transferase [Clostridium homopropionicum DSM 5847]|uniref:UDP-N-acetylglucosamine--N-acetylmuramyl-(pentapeptide) pyrophosphoryl-undecaprenol N-acetylglucosamine transferase n=1 Tax=Clostridium homopropionicum DSM 5847 TaxID=1121318 RepID=A0A0L6ZBY1_9CLOT|nr:undecaprenyldiphospho-muramoylpentapeptide beta-N-acetylglucosaminyltransferase [Clostridium homopropionicum]KOA20462.1 N-acetylglucosamine transferase [Clostridium homopropionicum DSM 5847]SFG35713.1 UDP-N-acetylglucosamine-N-acetylmuramylpentapeptide N-acetylglucosamine transferase [Clostridium homopropionicum]
MRNLKIIMTGGGSAGHVTPNLALIPGLKRLGYEVEYIGTENGIEKKIICDENIKYNIISSGKLRRYFDLKNFSDPFKVLKGVFEALKIIRKEKPNIVFSKGGFVSVPVVIGAYLNRVPVIIHESDITPGLANKISIPFATKVCVTFPESLKHIKGNKAILTGTPIREELFKGSKIKGKLICAFEEEKPILMIIGGSLGSKIINDTVREMLDKLLIKYNIIHICGKGNIANNLLEIKRYKQFEYVKDELTHLMAAADIFISRAGANVIFELLALKKPSVLIPLSAKASRGDQILNAESFRKSGFSEVIQEEELNPNVLYNKLNYVFENKSLFMEKINKSSSNNGVENVLKVIQDCTK